MVDVGRDPSIIEKINHASTGIGKHKVEMAVLTHSHYDHANMVPQVKAEFNSKIYAYSSSLKGVDHLVRDGEILKIADRQFEVIHSPGHSSDSICLYCKTEGVLFAGDTPLIIKSTDASYEMDFVRALEKIAHKNIKAIYPGHGPPVLDNCNELVRTSVDLVSKSNIKRVNGS